MTPDIASADQTKWNHQYRRRKAIPSLIKEVLKCDNRTDGAIPELPTSSSRLVGRVATKLPKLRKCEKKKKKTRNGVTDGRTDEEKREANGVRRKR